MAFKGSVEAHKGTSKFSMAYREFAQYFCKFCSEGCPGFGFGLRCGPKKKEKIIKACQCLESRVMEFFVSHGWYFIFRIGQ
jgi:hypothetical protein